MTTAKILVALPLMFLLVAVVAVQTYNTGTLPGRLANIAEMPITYAHNRLEGILLMMKNSLLERRASGLQLMGYNYARDLVQLSVTFRNVGPSPLDLTEVRYDGTTLTKGYVVTSSSTSITGIVFAQANHWNLDTGGSSGGFIAPGAVVTLYLGVAHDSRSATHRLVLVCGGQEYAFDLVYRQ
jgi:hypothetical protein